MTQEIFKRYEKKYIITKTQYQELISRMITQVQPGQYGKYTVCNIYFDAPDCRMIQNSLEKPVYKEKLRLRSYGVPGEEDLVYIELKKKYDGIVYKRRIPMKYKEARKYLYYGIRPDIDNQILREIDYAIGFYQVRPKVYLAYDRIAFYGKEDPELRITFDMDIRARQYCLELGMGSQAKCFSDKGMFLMEIKTSQTAMPLWLSRMLSELMIYPVSYSKYGTYYQEYMMKNSEEGGKACA